MEENDTPYSLEEQLKKSEINKNIQEVEKTKKEIEKIQAETNLINKSWWTKPDSWVSILGLSALAFFFNYVIIPSSQKDNIELSLKNAQVSDSLNQAKTKAFNRDKHLDSLEIILSKRDKEILRAYKELKRISKLKDCSDLQKQLKKFRETKSLTDEEIIIKFSKMGSSED